MNRHGTEIRMRSAILKELEYEFGLYADTKRQLREVLTPSQLGQIAEIVIDALDREPWLEVKSRRIRA